jgi:ribose 1,5-bisphosphokinase
MHRARLFYVMGASGSGKDSLIFYARGRLAGRTDVAFAHRYITRPADPVGENHIALSESEFDARLAAGLFAMHWRSHGLRYAIGKEINLWLAKGCSVVMNGSRGYLEEARQKYPELTAVLITVQPQTLADRLALRGRETKTQVAERLERAEAFRRPLGSVEVIENDGDLNDGGEQFLRVLLMAQTPPGARGGE